MLGSDPECVRACSMEENQFMMLANDPEAINERSMSGKRLVLLLSVKNKTKNGAMSSVGLSFW